MKAFGIPLKNDPGSRPQARNTRKYCYLGIYEHMSNKDTWKHKMMHRRYLGQQENTMKIVWNQCENDVM